MEKRTEIKRNNLSAIKNYIKNVVVSKNQEYRGFTSDYILNMVNRISIDESSVKAIPVEDRSLISEEMINSFLDSVYLDHLINYTDVFSIQDHIRTIKSTFDSSVFSLINRASDQISKIRDMESISEMRFSFTDSFHESFTSGMNYSLADKKLEINSISGTLRLPAVTENYGNPAMSDVKLSLVSTGMRVIDISEPECAYENDPTEPYFITAITSGKPVNLSLNNLIAGEYTGAVFRIVITFPSVKPVSRVSFVPFSNSPIEILSVHYSMIPDTVSNEELNVARSNKIIYDSLGIEINFRRVYAREIHIFVHQKSSMVTRSDVVIDIPLSIAETIDESIYKYENIMDSGFTEQDYLPGQIEEMISEIQRKSEPETEIIAAGMKAYCFGIYSLGISNCIYPQWGEYMGNARKANGNISSAALSFDATVDLLGGGDIIDAAILFGLRVAGKDMYLTNIINNHVTDAAILVQNEVYHNGSFIPNSTHPLKFVTHFLPEKPYTSNITLYIDGISRVLPGTCTFTEEEYGVLVTLPLSFCNDYDLYSGTVVTLSYTPADTDRYGRFYSPSTIDLIARIGKPNINNGVSSEIEHKYMYIPVEGNYISYAPELSNSIPAEYGITSIPEFDGYAIGQGKGEVNAGILTIGGIKYIDKKQVIGPVDNLYFGSIMEPIAMTTPSDGKFTVRTALPYIKGTLKVFKNGVSIPFVEYNTDATGTIIPLSDKNIFSITEADGAGWGIFASYVPIESWATSASARIGSNIAKHNITERYSTTIKSRITLQKYPFIDNDIISSDNWDLASGVFSLKYRYSVTYEPIVVYINWVKAENITAYRTDSGARPTFRTRLRQTDYQFYVDGGNTLVFDTEITGNIVVQYYSFADTIQPVVTMLRSNYNRTDMTPELYNYTIFANIQR